MKKGKRSSVLPQPNFVGFSFTMIRSKPDGKRKSVYPTTESRLVFLPYLIGERYARRSHVCFQLLNVQRADVVPMNPIIQQAELKG
jgi:hypothetical protein